MTKDNDIIYTLPDSPHTGTYCDVNDGGEPYIRLSLLTEGGGCGGVERDGRGLSRPIL